MRPSALLEVKDNRIALDFDFACTSRLRLYDTERENRQLEAMGGGLLANALGANTAQPQASKRVVEEW